MKSIIFILILLTVSIKIFSQVAENDSINKLYEQTVKVANELFKNNHYNESVAYYKAAKRLKPNEKLPQYRLEDIKTIYIKKDIAIDRKDAQKIIDNVKEKIALEEEQNKPDDFLYDIDTTLITKNANKQKHIDSLVAQLKIDSTYYERPKKKKKTVENNTVVTHPVLFAEKPKTEKKVEEKPKKETKKEQVEQPKQDTVVTDNPEKEIKHKNIKKEKKHKKKSKPVIVDEEKINKKLAKKYKDYKTIETIKKKHKTIKKVIINKNGKVTVYLKVMHDWGATYYFIDRSYYNEKNQDITQREFNAQTGEN